MKRVLPSAGRSAVVELEAVAGQFAQWRGTRERGGRIPENLWVAAVLAARKVGVSTTARVLNLGFGALKRRVSESPARAEAFVEMTGEQLLSASAAGPVLDWMTPGGLRLSVRLPAVEKLDWVALAGALRGVGP